MDYNAGFWYFEIKTTTSTAKKLLSKQYTKEIIDDGWDYKAILMEIYKKLNEYMTPQELK